jgi:probable rRNA maturation factor
LDLDLDLQLETADPGVPPMVDLRRWAMAALEGRRVRAELTIRVVGEVEGRELNRHYRGQDRPTNVLSFPFDVPPGIDPGDAIHDFLGDLVICADLVRREAQEQGKPVAAHWAHLVVHGILHLLDYDHLTDEDAAQMEGLETAILGGLGFPPPYQPDTEPAP